jgi:hypothetical protein
MDRVCAQLDRRPGTVALKGNHEDLMLRFLRSGDPRACALWLMNGGEATLASYDLDPPADPMDPAEAAACRDRLDHALPDAHRRLLETAPRSLQP